MLTTEETGFFQAAVASWTALTPPSAIPACPGVVCQTLSEPPVSKVVQRVG